MPLHQFHLWPYLSALTPDIQLIKIGIEDHLHVLKYFMMLCSSSSLSLIFCYPAPSFNLPVFKV